MKGIKPKLMKITKARHVLMCLSMRGEDRSVYAGHVAQRLAYLEAKRRK